MLYLVSLIFQTMSLRSLSLVFLVVLLVLVELSLELYHVLVELLGERTQLFAGLSLLSATSR